MKKHDSTERMLTAFFSEEVAAIHTEPAPDPMTRVQGRAVPTVRPAALDPTAGLSHGRRIGRTTGAIGSHLAGLVVAASVVAALALPLIRVTRESPSAVAFAEFHRKVHTSRVVSSGLAAARERLHAYFSQGEGDE